MNITKKKSFSGNERGRLKLVLGLSLFVAAGVLSRFFYIQIVHNRQYVNLGENQSIREANLYPKRGEIYDRKGTALAVNADLEQDDLKNLGLLADNENSVSPRRPIKRLYPSRTLAGQLIGFVGRDGYGLSGVEFGYDRYLYGEAGWSLTRYDAKSRRVYEVDLPVKSSVEGQSVQLTLSVPVQEIAEECLREGVAKSSAGAGAVIVMDPYSGDVLAMASYPFFDPNFFSKQPDGAMKNHALSMIYEPGSTFKIVAAAAALEEGVFREDDVIETGNGEFKIYDQIIHDTHKNGNVTFRQSIAISSNIAFAKIAMGLGSDRFFRYVKNFGFGQKTGIGLPGEEPGLFKPLEKWSGRTLMTMAIGQEVSVTLLQMATAYAAVANGGVLMAPRIVTGYYSGGQCVERVEVRPIRRLFSPRTARRLTDCLTGVVEKDEGTGVQARVEGVNIAGKTGTAQKIDPVTKLYQSDKFVASFAGFFPAESPELLCIVMLDEPKDVHYGGLTAAPVFKNIVTRILHSQELPYGAKILGRGRTIPAPVPSETFVPDLTALTRDRVISLCGQYGLKLEFEGVGDVALRQSLRAGRSAMPGDRITVYTEEKEAALEPAVEKMPQLLGMPLRLAVEKLTGKGIKIKVTGSGSVVRQDPAGGSELKKNSMCVLEAG